MQKKKFTSWGVSFASLALVAGMMSYMGITDKDTTSTTTVAATQNFSQSSQGESSQDSSITYEVPSQSTDSSTSTDTSTSTDSSTFTDSTDSTDTMGTGQQDDHSFQGQHGGFDTTTGGT